MAPTKSRRLTKLNDRSEGRPKLELNCTFGNCKGEKQFESQLTYAGEGTTQTLQSGDSGYNRTQEQIDAPLGPDRTQH